VPEQFHALQAEHVAAQYQRPEHGRAARGCDYETYLTRLKADSAYCFDGGGTDSSQIGRRGDSAQIKCLAADGGRDVRGGHGRGCLHHRLDVFLSASSAAAMQSHLAISPLPSSLVFVAPLYSSR